MLASQFLTDVNYNLRGTDDDAPAFDSQEGTYWISILNRKKRELYEDVTKTWSNTFDGTRTVGTISADAEPSYDLDEDFIAPSDKVYVISSTGQRTDYELVKPNERPYRQRYAYIAGMDPQVLYFSNEIATGEQIIGGTLYVPGYYMPDDVTSATDTIPFLTPDWAVLAVAAEIAGNDIIYEDKEANLTAKANNLYSLMVKRNRRGTYSNPRVSPIVVPYRRGIR